MAEYLLLFHSTLGVVQTKKALQAAGVRFRVADIPRTLRSGCGLSIWLHCPADELVQWLRPGQTESVYQCVGENEYRLIDRYPPA